MNDSRPLVLVVDDDARYIAEALDARANAARFVHAPSAALAKAPWHEVEALMALGRQIDDGLLEQLPRLRWIQLLSSGTDRLRELRPLSPQVLVTSARGVQVDAVSEMALMHMLTLNRNLPALLAQQRRHQWHRGPQPLLSGKTLVVIGTGLIAQELGQRCRALGMRTLAVSSTPREVAGFDEVLPRAVLAKAASLADFLVALVPLSPETEGLMNAEVFAAMKPGSFFINLARGGVCHEPDLIEALQQHRIAGAGLDVFATEPLPADHPFWDMPQVIVTPHLGGESDRYADSLLPLLEHNVRAFAAGEFTRMRNLQRPEP